VGWGIILKSQSSKPEKDKWDNSKLKTFCPAKESQHSEKITYSTREKIHKLYLC
jgi:hypothetical protein